MTENEKRTKMLISALKGIMGCRKNDVNVYFPEVSSELEFELIKNIKDFNEYWVVWKMKNKK